MAWNSHLPSYLMCVTIICVLVVWNTIDVAANQDAGECKEKACAAKTDLGGLEALLDATTTTVTEMVHLAKTHIKVLHESCCTGEKSTDRDTDFKPDIDSSGRVENGLPRDCAEAYKNGERGSGIYKIQPIFWHSSIKVYCDMKINGGGWTVIQRRDDIEPRQDFYLPWSEYKKGFGNLMGEFWLGNDHIFALTNQDNMTLRIDMADFEGNTGFAEYDNFVIRSEIDKYRMFLGTFQAGNAGDSLSSQNHMAFSTKDQDNDTWDKHCVHAYKGAFWHAACHAANLNGHPYRGNHTTFADGINWKTFKGYNYSLKLAEMKIRPLGFVPS